MKRSEEQGGKREDGKDGREVEGARSKEQGGKDVKGGSEEGGGRWERGHLISVD